MSSKPFQHHWQLLGAGAIGCLLASHLKIANHPVTLLVKKTVKHDGTLRITLETELETTHVQVNADATNQTGPAIDKLLVCTKAQDALAALKSIQHRLNENSIVLLLQNGMGVFEKVREAFPNLKIMVGVNYIGATIVNPFHVKQCGGQDLMLGDPQSLLTTEEQSRIVQSLSALPFNIQWDDDITSRMWEKLAINCAINPLTVIYQCKNGELLKNPEALPKMGEICNEIKGLANAVACIEPKEDYIDVALKVAKSTANNYSSMLQDSNRGKTTELAYLTGFVLEQGRKLGVSLPANQHVWEQLQNGQNNP